MLRDYQQELVFKVLSQNDNTLIQADTGAGKTHILAAIAKSFDHVLLIAHRNALVAQLSLEFAKAGLAHAMLCATSTARRAEALQRKNLGKSLFSQSSTHYICSIDTLLSKYKRDFLSIDVNKKWLIIVDEAHHMVEVNKWGKLATIFKNSRIIGATATPCRLDGVSLKQGNGGVFDSLVQAESLRINSVSTLIKRGFLSSFKCYGIESRLNESHLIIGKHDYTTESLIHETNKHVQEMAGDAVKHYVRLGNNKQALAFCVSIEVAMKTAKYFRDAGISAAAIHSKMSRVEVEQIFDLFQLKQIQVLCNVDMIAEGVDIPAIEALIMLRKTASLTLYRQWIGRSLRPCAGKEDAILIDHADNIRAHGLPNEHIEWSLNYPPTPKKSNLKPCPKCTFLVKAWADVCPECSATLRSETGFSERDILYIETELVEIYRTEKAREARENTIASSVPENEIRYLHNYGSKIADTSTKVALWFFNNIKNHITLKQAEDFFFINNHMHFWAQHFTLAEINKPNEKKCLRIFHETQRHLR